MRVVYKYELEITDTQEVRLYEFYTILKIAEQGGKLFMWVEVNPRRDFSYATIRIFGTGHPLDYDKPLTHLETVLMDYFVWHVYFQDTIPRLDER